MRISNLTLTMTKDIILTDDDDDSMLAGSGSGSGDTGSSTSRPIGDDVNVTDTTLTTSTVFPGSEGEGESFMDEESNVLMIAVVASIAAFVAVFVLVFLIVCLMRRRRRNGNRDLQGVHQQRVDTVLYKSPGAQIHKGPDGYLVVNDSCHHQTTAPPLPNTEAPPLSPTSASEKGGANGKEKGGDDQMSGYNEPYEGRYAEMDPPPLYDSIVDCKAK